LSFNYGTLEVLSPVENGIPYMQYNKKLFNKLIFHQFYYKL